MKQLFTLLFLLAFSLTAFPQSDHSRLDSFNSEYSEADPDLDTITIDFQVLNIAGNKAQIMSTQMNKKYEISVTPELNPFGYVLEKDREYTICLERDMNLVYKYQTRGQTVTLPARMIWFTVSTAQLKKDQRQLLQYIKEEPGYDRSPRY